MKFKSVLNVFIITFSLFTCMHGTVMDCASAVKEILSEAAKSYNIDPKKIIISTDSSQKIEANNAFILNIPKADTQYVACNPEKIRFSLYEIIGQYKIISEKNKLTQHEQLTLAGQTTLFAGICHLLQCGLYHALTKSTLSNFSNTNLTQPPLLSLLMGYVFYQHKKKEMRIERVNQGINAADKNYRERITQVCTLLFKANHSEALIFELIQSQIKLEYTGNIKLADDFYLSDKITLIEQFLYKHEIRDIAKQYAALTTTLLQETVAAELEEGLTKTGPVYVVHYLRKHIRLQHHEGNQLTSMGILYSDVIEYVKSFLKKKEINIPQTAAKLTQLECNNIIEKTKTKINCHQIIEKIIKELKTLKHLGYDNEFDSGHSLTEQIALLELFLSCNY